MPVQVELFIDATVKMKGQVVGGVRLRKPMNVPQVSDTQAMIELAKCRTLDELKTTWELLTQAEKNLPTVMAKKETLKTTLK
jgi:hypothetical protein